MSRMLGVFLLGIVVAVAAAQESRAAAQDVECTMILTYCPSSGSLSFECAGDCAPYAMVCILNEMGNLRYCYCTGTGGGSPRYAPCTLVANLSNGVLQCYNSGCAAPCPEPIVELVDGCYQIYCLC